MTRGQPWDRNAIASTAVSVKMGIFASAMEKMYEVVRIKQVIKEVEANERYIVHSTEYAANVAAQVIGNEDREVFFVMCLMS